MNAKHILAAALLAGSTATQAGVVFSDNFNTQVPGSNTPTSFTLVAGTVEIIGTGTNGTYFDLLPGNGYYIDLDGYTAQGGTLRTSFSLTAGTLYTAMFDLAGSQRGDTNIVDVTFGSLPTATYTLASPAPFGTFQLAFTPATTGSYSLTFTNRGGDYVGALLDNVSVTFPMQSTAVPEPESAALMLAGLGIGGWVSRRRVQRA